MNQLLKYLSKSGFRYDASAFTVMCREFQNASDEQRGEFVSTVRAMRYKMFLKTIYWGIVTGWVLGHDQHCRRCKARYSLNVHHRSYDIHGEEHRNLDLLEVLCMDCHREHHNLLDVEQLVKNHKRRAKLNGAYIPFAEINRRAREQKRDADGLKRLGYVQ